MNKTCNVAIRQMFSFKQSQNLDPSSKMDLDFWEKASVFKPYEYGDIMILNGTVADSVHSQIDPLALH